MRSANPSFLSMPSRVIVPKASDILAKQLRDSILAGDYPEGMLLPNERELSERSGLSRTSVREALRILEVEGLLTTRAGRNGGSAIRRPGRETLEHSLNLFIWGQNTTLETLLEVRAALEPPAARLAALHRTPDDLIAIDQHHARLTGCAADIDAFRAANISWHAAIMQASHNPLLISFYQAIIGAVHAATDIDDFHSPLVRREVIRIHERIAVAIRDSDGDAAARRMHRHVEAYIKETLAWAKRIRIPVEAPPPKRVARRSKAPAVARPGAKPGKT
jgi:GntR family transcriptional repressor for pyruvate dehydrogenase complex